MIKFDKICVHCIFLSIAAMASFHSSTEWKCTELVLIRHAESTNNVLYEQIREKFGSDVDEATVFIAMQT